MTDQMPPEPDRAKVWDRVKKAAQEYHNHHKDHGINTMIGADTNRSSQTVGDWKHGRSPIPMSAIALMAEKYGVSARYLAGQIDDPFDTSPEDASTVRAEAIGIVEQVLSRLKPDANYTNTLYLANLAIELLETGVSREHVVGVIYEKTQEMEEQGHP